MLSDCCRHRKAEVGVDVDLADCHRGRFPEHILRNADRVRHLSAVFVDRLNIFRNDRGSPVQNDREAGKSLFHFFQNIESELRLLTGFKFISAMARPDCNNKA